MVQEPSIMTMASDAGEWQQADSVYLQAVMFCLGWVMVRSIRLVASTLSRSTAGTAQVCNCGESFGHVTAVRSLTAPDLPVHEDSPPGSPVSAAPPSPPPPSTTSLALSVDGACATEPPSSVDLAGAALAFGLGNVLERRCATATGPPPAPWRRTGFHGAEESATTLAKLTVDLFAQLECSRACLPMALIYLDRTEQANAKLGVSRITCRRLLLCALAMAQKYHDDDYPSPGIEYYARVGGLSTREFAHMEREFCDLLSWKFYVLPEEFHHYHDLLYSAAEQWTGHSGV